MKQLILPETLTAPVAEVLGMMNFQTGPIAHYLRDSRGWAIARKCEAEQAWVLHWLLTLALEHGDGWRDKAREYLAEQTP